MLHKNTNCTANILNFKRNKNELEIGEILCGSEIFLNHL